jgi:hypothetical protein
MAHTLMFLLLALGLGLPPSQLTSSAPRPAPACAEGALVLKETPLPVPPPVFVRRAELPRLMVFVHGLQGNGVTSWESRTGVYWPSLVAADTQFREFDVYVYEYVLNTKAPVRLGDAAENFFSFAFKSGLVSRYRDVVFVTEGDGVFFVRELLRRVPPLASRVSMIFVAGRIAEASHRLDAEHIALVDENRVVGWRDFRFIDASTWTFVDPKPWIHCAVLGDNKPRRVTERDEGSSFCSTEPLVIPGEDWSALRPSCHQDQVHLALRRSVGQYSVPASQTKAAPATQQVTASSQPIYVPCGKILESFVELPIPVDFATEELLTVEPIVADVERLKAQKVTVERVMGKVAIIKYWLAGLDAPPVSLPGAPPACADGRATIRLQVLKRPKG